MDSFKVMAFDQSTTCTGVTRARVLSKTLETLETLAVYPEEFSIPALGFLQSKVRTTTSRGDPILSYVKHKTETVNKTEKKRRDTLVRNLSHTHRLQSISKELTFLIGEFSPDLILFEKNMAFGGILTTKQLAELAGAIHGIAASRNVRVKEYNVNAVRAQLNVAQLVKDFATLHTPQQLKKMGDVTKAALRKLMLVKYSEYNLNQEMTLDESDSLVIFDYWATHES